MEQEWLDQDRRQRGMRHPMQKRKSGYVADTSPSFSARELVQMHNNNPINLLDPVSVSDIQGLPVPLLPSLNQLTQLDRADTYKAGALSEPRGPRLRSSVSHTVHATVAPSDGYGGWDGDS